MMAKRKGHTKDRSDEMVALVMFAMVLMLPTAAIFLHASTSDRVLLPLSLLAFLVGATLEHRRLARRWRTVAWTVLGAYATSFIAFLPGRNERNYDLEAHLTIWPYTFCGLFVLYVSIAHRREIMAQLHEGISLLQSMAFGYWLLDIHGMQLPGPFMMVALVVVVLFTAFVLVNALLPIPLSRTNRLWLSLWSSCVLLVLAIDNIGRVVQLGYIEEANEADHMVMIVLNYVLLGVSSIYMVQNAMMLIEFFPDRGEGMGAAYRKRIDKLKKDHVSRYADEQLPFGSAVLCILFCVVVYGLNFHYGWVHRNFAIWSVLLVFPWVHFLFHGTVDRVFSISQAWLVSKK